MHVHCILLRVKHARALHFIASETCACIAFYCEWNMRVHCNLLRVKHARALHSIASETCACIAIYCEWNMRVHCILLRVKHARALHSIASETCAILRYGLRLPPIIYRLIYAVLIGNWFQNWNLGQTSFVCDPMNERVN